MATVTDKETFLLMWQTFEEVCPLEEGGEFNFFTGHSDEKVEGEWRDVNTGDLITWEQYWENDQPDGGSSEQCTDINRWGDVRDISCASAKCPICWVAVRAKLQAGCSTLIGQ